MHHKDGTRFGVAQIFRRAAAVQLGVGDCGRCAAGSLLATAAAGSYLILAHGSLDFDTEGEVARAWDR